MRRGIRWLLVLGLWTGAARAVAGDATPGEAALPPPLPIAGLRAGDWARWEGEQLSRTETLRVAHVVEVREVSATHVTVAYAWRNLTRDTLAPEDQTIWNSLPDMRHVFRLSLDSPPDAWALFTRGLEAGEGEDPSDGFQPDRVDRTAFRPLSAGPAVVEVAGHERETVHYQYLRPSDFEDDSPDTGLWKAEEWRVDGVPFGLVKAMAGIQMDFGDFMEDELDDLRKESLAQGWSAEETEQAIAEAKLFMSMMLDPDLPLDDFVARSLEMTSVRRELEEDGTSAEEFAAAMAMERDFLRDMMSDELAECAGPCLYSLTLAAYGDAENPPPGEDGAVD